jgi:hypothetical protein
MRPGVALTSGLIAATGGGALLLAACGGNAFTAGPTDAGTSGPSDAGADVGAGGGDGGSFCAVEAGTHTFCDDFDGLPLASKWSSIDQAGGGSAAVDSSKSVSPPNSFASVAPISATVATSGRVVEAFTQSASKVVVAFEVWFDSTPTRNATSTDSGDNFVTVTAGSSYTVGLGAHDTIEYFENVTVDGGGVQNLSSKDNLAVSPTSGWSEIVMTVDLANKALSLTMGGQPLLTPPAALTPQTGPITVTLGADQHNELKNSLAAHFDNVTIDLTP